MTNREAIEVIKLAQAQVEWECPMDYAAAFDMAISALQEQDLQPTCNKLAKDTNVPCKDAIERQAAIDATWKDPSYTDPLNVLTEVRDRIKALPSVQPEIVPCGDCKHWICHDRRCGYWNHGVKPLEWCCHAERRTE